MGTQEYRANYRVAMQEANFQLAEIFREFEQLQLRKEILEEALGALDPFLTSTAPAPVSYELKRQEPVISQPVRQEPDLSPFAAAPMKQPVAPASFEPVSELTTDIQDRINRALGLAVA